MAPTRKETLMQEYVSAGLRIWCNIKKIIPTIKHSDLIRTWYHYNCHSSPTTSPLGSLIHGRGEPKCAGLSRNFTYPATHFGWSTAGKWILNDGGSRRPEMSSTCRKTLIELVSADQEKSQLRWLKMQWCMPFSQVPSRACRVWESELIHDLKLGRRECV